MNAFSLSKLIATVQEKNDEMLNLLKMLSIEAVERRETRKEIIRMGKKRKKQENK